MATNVDKQPATVNINIEDSPFDTEEIVEREALTVNTGRGRRLNPGNRKKNDGRSRSNSRSPGRRGKRDSEKPRTDAVPSLPAEVDLPARKPTIEFDEEDIHDTDAGALDLEAQGKAVKNGRRRWWRRNPKPNIPFAQVTDPDGTVHVTENVQASPDVNVFQQKRNLAQGMMDLALLSANANQLKYMLESTRSHPFFYLNFTFIVVSIVVQVAVGVMVIYKSRYNIKNENDFYKANQINNFVTIGISIISIVNILSSVFTVTERPQE